MSHIPEKLLAKLNEVAAEVFEQAAADAYTIDKALDANEAFRRDGTVASPARRAVVRDATKRAASVAGLAPNVVSGGAVEFIAVDGNRMRCFRLKTAVPQDDGTYQVVAGAGSTLLQPPDNDVLAWWEERWVLGCVWADNHTVEELFVAEVRGPYQATSPGPVRLELGPVCYLTGLPTPPDFESDEYDNLGRHFEDDEARDLDDDATGGTA